MKNISFNTMTRIVSTINANKTKFDGVPLKKVYKAACDYSHFFRLVVNFLSIEAGKQYYSRLDEQKKTFGGKLILKLKQVHRRTEKITIDVAGHKIELRNINAFEMECTIDGVIQGRIEGTLNGLKALCNRRYAH